MPRRRDGTRGFGFSAEINMAPLIDVAFTLLVIFIITAPILQGGVDIDVPQAQSEPISSPEGVIVSVDRDGEIFIGESSVSWGGFESALRDVVRERGTSSVFLRADQSAEYGSVLRVLGAMKALDLTNVGLVAQPTGPLTGGEAALTPSGGQEEQ